MKKHLLLFLASLFIPWLSQAQCTLNAGADLTVCGTQDPVPLQASAAQFTTFQWTTNGTGTFSNTNILNPVYLPTMTDLALGSVSMTITASGGGCTIISDVIVITFIPMPVIDAGLNQTACANDNVSLNASVNGATGIVWTTSGTGVFAPSAQAINAIYIPSMPDLVTGTVTLTVTSTGNGVCLPVSDQVIITYIPSPVVNAGLDKSSCFTNPVSLSDASASSGSTILWSTNGSGTFSNITTLNPVYAPTVADVTTGTVTLTLTATSGICTTNDQVVITFTNSAPVINAGPDLSMCSNNVSLNASFSGAAGILWSTAGTGTFSNTTSASTIYTPSAGDRASGNVVLTATTTGNGSCPAVTDAVTVTISPRAILIIGPDQTVCPNALVFPTASINAGSLTWSTAGTGVFSNITSPTPVYTPSAADKAAGQVTLTATSSQNGACPVETGSLQVTFASAIPTANAGPDITVCGNTVNLSGSVTNATGGSWTASGTGTYSPGQFYLNNTYTFSAADIATGTVIFTLTTTGSCGTAVSDAVTVTIASSSLPVVNAGPDQTISGGTASLNGTLSGASGVLWTSSGTGSFSSSTSPSTVYTPSSLDIANGLVELTITSTGNGACVAAQDKLLLTIGNSNTISGLIKAATNPLDKGLVLLFKKNGAFLDLIKTDIIALADAGAYAFTDVPSGIYIIFATPVIGSAYLFDFLPTYSGGTQHWNMAQVITVNGNSTQNIQLTPFICAIPTWNTGLDILAGIIYRSPASQPNARMEATDIPAAYATVYLTDENGNNIAYTQTDANGRYSFENIVIGKYAVVPEFGGLGLPGTALPLPVIADGNASTVEDASMKLETQALVSGITSAAKPIHLTAYPNPAGATVSVDIISAAATGTVKLMNETGMVKMQQEVNLNDTRINVNIEQLPAGVYILQLTAGEEIYTAKVLKF